MSDPARFLTALAQALSVMALYPEGHPSRERAIDLAYEQLSALCAGEDLPLFTFLDGDVVFGRQRLRDMRGWEWAGRLASAGIGRLEFERSVSRDELESFLSEVLARLTLAAIDTSDRRQMRDLGVRFGAVGVAPAAYEASPITGEAGQELTEEVATLQWLQAQVGEGAAIPMREAEAVVRSLSVAMRADRGMLLPLLELKEFDQYTTTHSLNVSVLSMALAEALGLTPREVRAIGVAGLLHDVGKVRIPIEILTKPGKLTEEEREVINRHPSDGARLILRSDAELDLAAVVAYEHHIMLNGGGYPAVHYHRDCTLGSRLVHVCDVYDALSTRRPYREAWPQERSLSYLEERAGSEFDPPLVAAFARMMRQGDARLCRLAPDGTDGSARRDGEPGEGST